MSAHGHAGKPARPPYPDHTPESMAREVEENPDIARELFADEFAADFCVVCGDGAALYATPVWFSPCRRCLAKRMRALMERRDDLPWWVSYLADNCQRAVDLEDQKALAGPTVTFEPFAGCVACKKLMPEEDARYWYGTNNELPVAYSRCVPCYEDLRDRNDPTIPTPPSPTCAGCGKPILPYDSAHWVGEGSDLDAGSPYCVPCYEELHTEPEA